MEENGIIVILKKIWPTVYRIINGTLYFIINILKAIIVGAIRQIREF